jgi:hypothetical protein
MRVVVRIIALLAFTCFLAVPMVEGGELDDFVKHLSIRAEADSGGFRTDLAAQFRVPGAEVDVLLRAVDSPGDAYMCLRIAQVAHVSTEVVLREYRANRNKGWGVIAKNLGIKPGSKEFHELKNGHFGSDVKRQEKRKGKGRG